MAIYFIGTILSLIFASLAAASERSALQITKNLNGKNIVFSIKSRRFFFALMSALPLIIIASLRHEVGTDWPIYDEHFYGINELQTDPFSEIGFTLLNKIVYAIYPDFALMVAVCSIITYGFFFKAIYDQSINYSFSILFFVLDAVYFNSMNQVRQMMTLAIFLYAIKFIKQRKFLPYLIIILIAFTIHTSAIICLPFYFLYGFRVRPLLHAVSILAGLVLMVPVNKVMEFIVSKTQYSWYLDSVFSDSVGFYLIGFAFSVIILFLYDFYYYYGENKDDKDYNFIVNLYWLGTMMVFFTTSIPQSSRLLICFTTPLMLGIPMMLKREKIHHRRVVLCILVIAIFLANLLYNVYVNEWYHVIPYQSVFDR